MSDWNHICCDECYTSMNPAREAHRDVGLDRVKMACCWCHKKYMGFPLYVRRDPKKMRCDGNDEGQPCLITQALLDIQKLHVSQKHACFFSDDPMRLGFKFGCKTCRDGWWFGLSSTVDERDSLEAVKCSNGKTMLENMSTTAGRLLFAEELIVKTA